MPFSPYQMDRFAEARASVESLCRSEVVRARVNPEAGRASNAHFFPSPPAPPQPRSLANPASPDSTSFNWLEADDEEVESAIRTSCEPNDSDSGSDGHEPHHRDLDDSTPPLSAVINNAQPGARLSRRVSGPRQPHRKTPSTHSVSSHSIGQSPQITVPAPRQFEPHTALPELAAKEELDEGYRSDATSSEDSASDADSLVARRGSTLFTDSNPSDSQSNRKSTGQATYIDQSPIVPSEEENAFWTGGSGRNSSNYAESVHQTPAPASRTAGAWQQIEPQELNISSSLFPSKEPQSSRQAQRSLVLPTVTTLTARAPRRTDLRWRQSRIPVPNRKTLSVLNTHDETFPSVDGSNDRRASHRFSNSFDAVSHAHKLPQNVNSSEEGLASQEDPGKDGSVHKETEMADDDSDEYEASESSAFSYVPDVQVHTATKMAINLPEAELVKSPSLHRFRETKIFKHSAVQTEPLESVPVPQQPLTNDKPDDQDLPTDQPRSKKRPELRIDTGQGDSSRSSGDLKLIAVQVGSGKVVSTDSEKENDTVQCPQCGHSFEHPDGANKDATLSTSVSEARKLAYARVRARAAALAKVSSSALKSAAKLAEEMEGRQPESDVFKEVGMRSDANASVGHENIQGKASSSTIAPKASTDAHRKITSRRNRELPIIPAPDEEVQMSPSAQSAEIVNVDAKDSMVAPTTGPSRKRTPLGRWNAGSELHSRGSSFQSFIHPFDSRPGSAFSTNEAVDVNHARGRRGSDRGQSSSEEAESISSSTLLSRLRSSSSHLQELTTLNGCLPIGAFKSGGSSNSSALGKSFDSHTKRTSNTSSWGLQPGGPAAVPATAGYFLPPLGSHVGGFLQGSVKAKDSALSLQDTRELRAKSPEGGAVLVSDEEGDDAEDSDDDDDEPQPTPPCRSAKALKVLGLETQPGMPGQLVNAPDPIVPVHPAGHDVGLPSLSSSLKKRRSTSFSGEQDKTNAGHVPVISEPFNVEHVASANTNMGFFTSPSSTTAPVTPAIHSAAAILERTEKIAAGPDSSPTRPMQRFKHALRRGKPNAKDGGSGIEYGSFPNDPLPLLPSPALRPPPLKRGAPFQTDGNESTSSSSVLSKFRHRRGESDLVQNPASVSASVSAPPTGQGANSAIKTTPPGRSWALPSLDLNDSPNFKLHSFEMRSSDETPRNTAHGEQTPFVHGELANAPVL